jgi:hypothetical protein
MPIQDILKGTWYMLDAKFEQDPRWFQRGIENLKRKVAILEARLCRVRAEEFSFPRSQFQTGTIGSLRGSA